jgi:hypothetical protein
VVVGADETLQLAVDHDLVLLYPDPELRLGRLGVGRPATGDVNPVQALNDPEAVLGLLVDLRRLRHTEPVKITAATAARGATV